MHISVTINNNYSVEVIIFPVSFQIWKRKESEYSFLWRTHGLEKSELLRPEFTGKMQPSPITGQPEKYFPRWKRWLRYGLSFVLTLPVLALAVGAMLCSLNFNGYIKDKESPVYIAAFAHFAEPVSQLKYSFLSIFLNVVESCFFDWKKIFLILHEILPLFHKPSKKNLIGREMKTWI